MNRSEHVEPLAIELSRSEVVRHLGYPALRNPTDRVQRALDSLWPCAMELIDARGVWAVVEQSEATSSGVPAPTGPVGLGVCTVGPLLEAREQDAAREQRVLEALILDAIGSTAAEAAADALTRQLCIQAQELGCDILPRISPGYGDWSIQYQPALLAALKADRLGIQLTEGLMMIPRKSVSFAVRFCAPNSATGLLPVGCAACECIECPYRRATHD